ncbi:hypothetical protein vBEco4M7_08 [Escherichia phage vB_Eco4M-7]|nr:hypothetical protein vBEco4M7_08 [Escherichia phage vB_Eco4M-7]
MLAFLFACIILSSSSKGEMSMSYDERFGRSGLFHDAVHKDSKDVVCAFKVDSYGTLKPFKVGETYKLFHGWLTRRNNLPDMEVWWIEYKGQAHRCKVVEVRGVEYYQSVISGFVFKEGEL